MEELPVMGGWEATKQTAGPETYALASWLFLRLLGLIYLAAFTSLATQIQGLAGQKGILPAAELFSGRQYWGVSRYWRWPSLCWINCSDTALLCLSWGGAGLAVLLTLGVAPLPVLILLWLFYLSLFTACRLFLCYQWDILLLETGFLALFLAPLEMAPHFPPRTAPASPAIWLFWWLLFRLLFWSGAVKLRGGDATWRNFTALKYHYETQPLPTPLAWYAHQLPVSFHKFSVAVVFVIELAVPFLIFAPPPCRYGAAWLIISLMLLIELTGNYAFFNLLGIALSLLAFDDAALSPAFRFALPADTVLILPPSPLSISFATAALLLVLVLSVDSLTRLLRFEVPWPRAMNTFFDLLEPFRLVNSYGLFALMTTRRPEIIVEGSNDGTNWLAYEFKFKPGDVQRAPRFVAPHQPRLDWQLWFAALSVHVGSAWFDRLCARVIQGSPAVLSLLQTNPFPDAPPRYLRGMVYDYHFTSAAERRATGAWWKRERRGLFVA